MDMDVIMRSHNCAHIVRCYGCFVFEVIMPVLMQISFNFLSIPGHRMLNLSAKIIHYASVVVELYPFAFNRYMK